MSQPLALTSRRLFPQDNSNVVDRAKIFDGRKKLPYNVHRSRQSCAVLTSIQAFILLRFRAGALPDLAVHSVV